MRPSQSYPLDAAAAVITADELRLARVRIEPQDAPCRVWHELDRTVRSEHSLVVLTEAIKVPDLTGLARRRVKAEDGARRAVL